MTTLSNRSSRASMTLLSARPVLWLLRIHLVACFMFVSPVQGRSELEAPVPSSGGGSGFSVAGLRRRLARSGHRLDSLLARLRASQGHVGVQPRNASPTSSVDLVSAVGALREIEVPTTGPLPAPPPDYLHSAPSTHTDFIGSQGG